MCVYVHGCTSTCVFPCVWGFVHQSMYVYVHMCVCMSVCIFVSVCLCVCMSVCLCLCVCMCVCLCVCVLPYVLFTEQLEVVPLWGAAHAPLSLQDLQLGMVVPQRAVHEALAVQRQLLGPGHTQPRDKESEQRN